ncbi:hypothetical protein [Butyrivibrio sp. AE2032]|uniref:hypothetical protein n=1 Tax=Butyrivibrio sp. AE2032 TaxID=1458463 RepID=UPI00163B2C4E|nr:hypothetical protein [Butyrivibrio sp. AE2032]
MVETVGENRVDVLCFGSSHAANGFNPIQMYEDEGIAAYVITYGSQAPWQSYYYIKEACKVQNPKLIIFDTYMLGAIQNEDTYEINQPVINMLNCPLSINKIKTVMVSRADSRLDLLLVFPFNHDEEFNGFSLNKFYGKYIDSMGYDYKGVVVAGDVGDDVSNCMLTKAISKKNEKYLRKIIDYCKENEIELILANTPWPCVTEEVEMYFNYIAQIARENNIPFIDGCKLYKEMGIDYSTDCCASDGHLNDNGVTKYNKWLEDYLSSNYELPDRRGETDYAPYERGIVWLEEVRKENDER